MPDTFEMVTVSSLPAGTVIEKSMDRILDTGLRNGAAITHDPLSVDWYASDFMCGPLQNCLAATVHFGPYAHRYQAVAQLDGEEYDYLESNGTDGTSTWLELT